MLSQQHIVQDRIEGCHDQVSTKVFGFTLPSHSTPLCLHLLTSDLKFALTDVHATAEVAVDIIHGSFC